MSPDDGGTQCSLLQPPTRPEIPPATDQVSFVVVVDTLDFGDRLDAMGEPEHREIGYDLDGVCTDRGGAATCTPYGWIEDALVDNTDGTRGQDSAIGKLLASQEPTFGAAVITSESVNRNVALGVEAPLGVLRVSDYGGLGDDDSVEVDWYVALAPDLLEGGPFVPKFDGTDAWPVSIDHVEDPTVATAADTPSVFRDTEAYVTQRVLVARFDEVPLPLANVFFPVRDITLTGTVVRDMLSGFWSLEGAVVSGKTASNDLLEALPQVVHAVYNVPVCTDEMANYPLMKRFLCAAGDLPADVDGPPTQPCSVSSVGIRLTTAPSALGVLGSLPAIPPQCPPPTDPANDTCAVPPP